MVEDECGVRLQPRHQGCADLLAIVDPDHIEAFGADRVEDIGRDAALEAQIAGLEPPPHELRRIPEGHERIDDPDIVA